MRLISIVIVFTSLALIYVAFGDKLVDWGKKGEVREIPEGFEYSGTTFVDSNGIHVNTGLMYGPGFVEVQRHCLACHSSKLITQSRSTREGWDQTLTWMQQTQGLWDLGADKTKILDYLAEYYAPEEIGRRASLNQLEIGWYKLEQ
jgi:hypothetical protein